jgi:hypothetical protein
MSSLMLRELIERLWNAGSRGSFSEEVFLKCLLEDGGQDLKPPSRNKSAGGG